MYQTAQIADNHTNSVQRGAITLPRFDPAGIFWRVNREGVVLLGGGAALLLQIAHPLVAEGVLEHSNFRSQPIRRLYRTVTAMHDLVYGPEEAAYQAALGVRHAHVRVRGTLAADKGAYPAGTPYSAADPQLMLWVQATLIATAIRTYEIFVRPLSDDEKAAYYSDSKRVALALGLATQHMPETYRDFVTYYAGMLDGPVLSAGGSTRELADQIIHPPISWVPRVAGDVLSIAVAALLPEQVRRLYGLSWGAKRQAAWRVARGSLRRALPYLPDLLRHNPRARRGERRLT